MIKDLLTNFSEKINSMQAEFNKLVASKVFGKKYIRTGKCNSCGRCCQRIYVRHSNDIIKTEEEFERLKPLHFFYRYLEIIDKDDAGLVFECTKLNKETGKCTAYKQRALICRQYPLEEIFMLGGVMGDECGFKFVPIQSFEEILSKLEKKNFNAK